MRQGFFDAKVEGRSREDLRNIATGTWEGLDACLDRLVRYLVFADEASLGNETWRESEAYRESFLADRKIDGQGRSLKDLRLKEHIFKHRCSYMIYSKSFTGLPVPLKEEIYHRLHRILSSKVEGFDHFEPGEKEAIAGILVETLPELAAYWNTIEAG